MNRSTHSAGVAWPDAGAEPSLDSDDLITDLSHRRLSSLVVRLMRSSAAACQHCCDYAPKVAKCEEGAGNRAFVVLLRFAEDSQGAGCGMRAAREIRVLAQLR